MMMWCHRPSARQRDAKLSVDQFSQRCRVRFVAGMPGLQPSELRVGRAGQDSAILVRPRLIASARIVVNNRFLSLARSPDFKCVKCRVKPVVHRLRAAVR